MQAPETKVQERSKGRFRKRWLLLGLLLLWLVAFGGGLAYFVVTKDPFVSRTPAVNQVLGLTVPRYVTAINGVAQPTGVAVSPDGQRIYAADNGPERVLRIFDANGNELAAVAPPNTSKHGRAPTSVVVGKKGTVYLGDINTGALYMFSRDGDYLGELKPDLGSDKKWRPTALAFDKQGNLYVADYRPDVARILVIDPDGNLKRQFGERGMGTGQISAPSGIVVRDDKIYVADANTRQVLIYDQEGSFLQNLKSIDKSGFGLPRGLAFDAQGRLYVTDSFSHGVQVLEMGEEVKGLFYMGKYGREDGQFSFPSGVAVDGRDRIYVADRVNNRIQVWLY